MKFSCQAHAARPRRRSVTLISSGYEGSPRPCPEPRSAPRRRSVISLEPPTPQPPGPPDAAASGRRSRILGGMSTDARSVTIAVASTVVFLVVVVSLSSSTRPAGTRSSASSSTPSGFPRVVPRDRRGVSRQRSALLPGRGLHPRGRFLRRASKPCRAQPFPLRLPHVYTGIVFRGILTILVICHARVRIPALAIQGLPSEHLLLGRLWRSSSSIRPTSRRSTTAGIQSGT